MAGTSYRQLDCWVRQTWIVSAGVLAGLVGLLAAVRPAASEQLLPEPTETFIATVDPATWAKVIDRSDHLPQYTLRVFNAPAPGETVFWGVERYDEKNLGRGILRYVLPDYAWISDWQCFANEKPAALQARDGLRYLLMDGKEYGPFGPCQPLPAFHAVRRDDKFYLSSSRKQYGPFDELGRIADNGERVIFWFRREGRWYVAVDDREFGPYDYRGGWEELRLELSQDGKRFAFTARRPAGWYFVVDGQEYGPYEFPTPHSKSLLQELFADKRFESRDPGWEDPRFEFSPDGKRFAFTARRPAGWYLVVDGQEYGPYEMPRYQSEFSFSSDGAHFALTARRGRQWWLLVDGKEIGPYDLLAEYDFRFSSDNAHYAVAARRGGQWWLLADGKEIGPLEAKPWWEFQGPDLCYIAKQRGAFHIVLGDKGWGPYEEAEPSLGWRGGDGNPRRAFRVKRGGAWYAMSGDLELGPFEELHACGLSPDGSRIIAFAGRAEEWYAMMDGTKYGPYERLVAKSSPSLVDVIFSHTSGQVAFAAWRGGQWLLVADGKEYPSGYGELGQQELRGAVNFSPDDQRAVLAFLLAEGSRPPSDRLLVVVAPGGRLEPLWFRQEGGSGFASALPDWWEERFPVWNPNSGKLMGIVRSAPTAGNFWTESFWTEGYLGKSYQAIYSESLRLEGPDAVTFVAGNEGKLLLVRQPLK